MVILEAAAITAGSVAAYKGGKAAACATAKSVKKSMKLSGQEKQRKEVDRSRKADRKERFSKINEYRSSLKDVDGNLIGDRRGGAPNASFDWRGKLGKGGGGATSSSSSSSRGASSSLSAAGSYSTGTSRRASSSSNTRSCSSEKSSGSWWGKK